MGFGGWRWGSPHIWPLRVGLARAKEYLVTGDPIAAIEAERIGLINRVVPAEQLMPAAMALAQRLASGPQQAIRGTKLCLNKRVKEEVNLAQDLALSLEMRSMTSDDYREAVLAKMEKRRTRWDAK
ncbi:MAG: enoyl-CoA hydratase-related protein [Dehalococcoidia bacterium]|nr:enoyl-CoA hydratase-related protein [Dehalococcoidia bacterium]